MTVQRGAVGGGRGGSATRLLADGGAGQTATSPWRRLRLLYRPCTPNPPLRRPPPAPAPAALAATASKRPGRHVQWGTRSSRAIPGEGISGGGGGGGAGAGAAPADPPPCDLRAGRGLAKSTPPTPPPRGCRHAPAAPPLQRVLDASGWVPAGVWTLAHQLYQTPPSPHPPPPLQAGANPPPSPPAPYVTAPLPRLIPPVRHLSVGPLVLAVGACRGVGGGVGWGEGGGGHRRYRPAARRPWTSTSSKRAPRTRERWLHQLGGEVGAGGGGGDTPPTPCGNTPTSA